MNAPRTVRPLMIASCPSDLSGKLSAFWALAGVPMAPVYINTSAFTEVHDDAQHASLVRNASR